MRQLGWVLLDPDLPLFTRSKLAHSVVKFLLDAIGGAMVQPDWIESISEEDWSVYSAFLKQALMSEIRFAIGGAFALAVYTNHLRNTKDLDIYVLPSDRDRMIEITKHCGFSDYFSLLPYDRHWIYRSCCGPHIVDLIWAMPNRRAQVDERWLTAGPTISARGFTLKTVPIEELMWSKMYVVQRERCDWPDIMNLLYFSGSIIDWEHLLSRVADDGPLLKAVLTVFDWLHPGRSVQIPDYVWQRLKASMLEADNKNRAHLLDTRPWFGDDFQRWPV
jgi:hypothetical protein